MVNHRLNKREQGVDSSMVQPDVGREIDAPRVVGARSETSAYGQQQRSHHDGEQRDNACLLSPAAQRVGGQLRHKPDDSRRDGNDGQQGCRRLPPLHAGHRIGGRRPYIKQRCVVEREAPVAIQPQIGNVGQRAGQSRDGKICLPRQAQEACRTPYGRDEQQPGDSRQIGGNGHVEPQPVP